ncbi:MAG: ATP-binding protein [Planctomycetota bacterium]
MPPTPRPAVPLPEEELRFLRETNAALSRSLGELLELKDVAHRMVSALDRAPIEEALRGAVARLADGRHFDLYFPSEGGWRRADGATVPVTLDELDWVAENRKPVSLSDAANPEEFLTVVPLAARGETAGFLVIRKTGEDFVTPQNVDKLALVCGLAGASFLNIRLIGEISERSRDLLRARNLFRDILESITAGIVTLDKGLGVTQINRNALAMFGLDDPDVVGRAFRDIIPEPLRDPFGRILQETLETGFCLDRQVPHTPAPGIEILLGVSATLLRNEDATIEGVVVVCRDMTATRELERLRKIDRLKSEFVSNVSHELRTPLTSIKAYTDVLLGMAKDETQKKFLGVIDSESDRLLALIEDLLNISRIESGKIHLEAEPVDPRALVDGIMGMSKVQSRKHNLVVDMPETLPEVPMDRKKMTEVLINLVSNAIKYSPKGGQVRIRVRVEEGNLRFDVSDSGIGIGKEDLPKLFQKFSRVDSSLTAEIGGTGLGLSIVKAIVEAHGGLVTVDSEPGRGSTFTVRLPLTYAAGK